MAWHVQGKTSRSFPWGVCFTNCTHNQTFLLVKIPFFSFKTFCLPLLSLAAKWLSSIIYITLEIFIDFDCIPPSSCLSYITRICSSLDRAALQFLCLFYYRFFSKLHIFYLKPWISQEHMISQDLVFLLGYCKKNSFICKHVSKIEIFRSAYEFY